MFCADRVLGARSTLHAGGRRGKERAVRHERSSDWRRGAASSPDPKRHILKSVKFGLLFQLQTPRPLDADTWHEGDEQRVIHQALEQIEFADSLGFDYVFFTEHHFLEEYCHSAAPEVIRGVVRARAIEVTAADRSLRRPPRARWSARSCA